MPIKLKIPLVFVFTMVFLALFTRVAYACSPTENFVYVCADQTVSRFLWTRDELRQELESCPDLLPAVPVLQEIVFAEDVGLTVIFDNNSANLMTPPEEGLQAHYSCFLPEVSEYAGFLITYLKRPPYCVRQITFCEQFTASPSLKMWFDLKNGNPLLALTMLTASLIGIVSGQMIGKGAFITKKFKFFYSLAKMKRGQVIWMIMKVGFFLFVVCKLMLAFIIFSMPIFNWLLHPSIAEFHTRLGFLSFLGTLTVCQTRLWRQGKANALH